MVPNFIKSGLVQSLLIGSVTMVGGIVAAPHEAAAEVVCSKAGSEFDFTSNQTDGMRAKLSNPNYFGPGAAVAPETLTFSTLATVTAGTLAGCNVFIGGGFQENLNAAEGDAIEGWLALGGDRFVIGGCDSGSNRTCNRLGRGLTQFGSGAGVTLTTNISYNPLTCGGAGTVQTFGGQASRIDTINTDTILATHDGGGMGFTGSAAAITDNLLDPTFLMTADADMFANSGNETTANSTDAPVAITNDPVAVRQQDIFILNVFKFSLDGLKGRLGKPQCYDDYNRITDLALSMSATPTGLAVGSTTVVTLTVDNQSLELTEDIEVTSAIPAGFTFASATGDGTYNDGTGTWDIGTLAGGGSATIQITMTATSFGTPTMLAEITNANLPDDDSAPNSTFGEDDLLDGIADDDERSITFSIPLRDFGDAAGFADNDNGTYNHANHILDGLTFLGAGVTDESTSQIANGDASDDANDDGVTFPTASGTDVLRFGENNSLSITASVPGFLNAFADWNQDGDFEDAGEQFATDRPLIAGANALSLSFPDTTPMGSTFLRFRFSTATGLAATGEAPDGEVEDYQVAIAQQIPAGVCSNALGNFGFDLPTTPNFTLFRETQVPFWAMIPINPNTSNFAARNRIELWDDNFNSVPAFDSGDGSLQFAELNANVAGGLYQDFIVPPGQKLGWRFAHRGRSGNETVRVLIGPPGSETNEGEFTTGTTEWKIYSGAYTVPPGQSVIRFKMEAVGGSSIGNFLDAVEFQGACDFGDAPDSYLTSLSSGGPYHYAGSEMRLGALPGDSEPDATPNGTADGDDTNSSIDDEDGVTLPAFSQGVPATVTVSVTGNGFLQGWIDWNGNGTFDGIEQIATDVQDTDSDGTILLTVTPPADAATGTTYARFRWSSDANIGFAGQVDDGEVEDYQVTIGGGSSLSGKVFVDNGVGTAHDGVQNGTELGTNQAMVTLYDDATDAVLATPTINADGTWTATLAPGFSGTVRLEVIPVPAFRPISEGTAGVPIVANAAPTDGLYTFSYTSGTAQSGLDVGIVETPTLTENQSSTVTPGQVIDLPHVYTATTSGVVNFTLLDQVGTPAGAFTSTLFEDVDCNGTPDQVLAAGKLVDAGAQVCLVVRTQASAGVGPSASYTYGITVTTAYSGTAVSDTARNDDAIGAGTGDELLLRKLVANLSKMTPEGTANSGEIGDVLRYRIIMSNPASQPAQNVVVYDQTPAYTELNSPVAAATVVPGVTCAVTVPAAGANTAGYTGPLQWTCPGSFPAGSEGSVTFEVRIAP